MRRNPALRPARQIEVVLEVMWQLPDRHLREAGIAQHPQSQLLAPHRPQALAALGERHRHAVHR